MPAGSVVLVTTQLESVDGRKVWMSASVTDGASPKPYALGRALFVAPNVGKHLSKMVGK